MRVNSLTLEVEKGGLRQHQDGTIKISLTCHPDDVKNLLAFVRAAAGTRYMIVLEESGDDEKPVG